MHILLTDALTCPRCGPDFGLIVLADRMHDRRVVEGRLGCANCRTEYPIARGVVDLRLAPPAAGGAALAEGDAERALRLAALSGVGQGQGTVLTVGVAPTLAEQVDALLPNAQVIGASAEPPAGGVPEGMGWLLFAGALPFRTHSLRALVLSGAADPALFPEGARALARGAHLVADPAPAGARARMEEAGLSVLLEQEGVAVASNPGPR